MCRRLKFHASIPHLVVELLEVTENKSKRLCLQQAHQCLSMDSFLLWTLALSMMFAGGHCGSSSMSCSTVDGKTICERQSGDGNMASASSGSYSGSQGSFQSAQAAGGDSTTGRSRSSRTQVGDMPPGFAGAFAGFPGMFPFAPGVSNFDYSAGSSGPGSFGTSGAGNTGTGSTTVTSISGSDGTSAQYAGTSTGGYAGTSANGYAGPPAGGFTFAGGSGGFTTAGGSGGFAVAGGGGGFAAGGGMFPGGVFVGGFPMPVFGPGGDGLSVANMFGPGFPFNFGRR